ncbi:phosphatase PAP2 family protein [Janibacter sp. GXQ6167]|uniref:phosphatase PAP2 family protein n=1 Tax=Janibacter sp. GXQ6167 TaxID=3240791 RepID=UPI003523A26A
MPPTRRQDLGRWLLALGALIAIAALAAGLGVLTVKGEAPPPFDTALVDDATRWAVSHPGFVDGADMWSQATYPWVMQSLLALVAIGLVLAGAVGRRALAILPLAWITWGLGSVTKVIVDRPRPGPQLIDVQYLSFPSGHALNATLAIALIGVLLFAVVKGATARLALALLGLAIVVITVLNRVVLGVHYPSDVIAGVLIGAASAAAIAWWLGGARMSERSSDPLMTRERASGAVTTASDARYPD